MLDLHAVERGDFVQGFIDFSTDLFDKRSVQCIAERLLVLSRNMMTQVHATVWSLGMATSGELDQVIWRYNDTAALSPCHTFMQDLVIAQVHRTPTNVALQWNGEIMAYDVLWRSARHLATRLKAHQVTTDCVVALQLHRSLEQAVGVLGVLIATAAYLPLDMKWPMERRSFMMNDAICDHLVAQSVHISDFKFAGAAVPLNDARDHPPTDSTIAAIKRCATPEHLAYVMYTSGSTGKPKGVMVSHAGVVNLLVGAQLRYRADPTSTFAVPTPYVFDVSVYNIFSSLVVHCGPCCLLYDGSTLAMPSKEEKYSRVAAVPSILVIARLPRAVQHVEVGGEALTQNAVDNVRAGVNIYNYYGPTEVAIWSTRRVVVRADITSRLASIGRPLCNVTSFVVDPISSFCSMQPQAVGVFGELWLGGVQVARGYLNRSEKTAEAFIANPWPSIDPSGQTVFYRTGDRVRWYADGELEFGGRIDFQVKLRGQRLELGEIEHALCSIPSVIEAIVLLRTDVGEPSLVAYVHPISLIGGDDLEDNCNAMPFDRVSALAATRDALPAYMLPSLVVGIDEWPRTSSNKIDRKKLPLPSVTARRVAASEHRRDRTKFANIQPSLHRSSAPYENKSQSDRSMDVARAISDEISAILSIPIGDEADQPIFELGVTSLQAVVIVRALSERFRTTMPVTVLFENATTRRLSSFISRQLGPSTGDHLGTMDTLENMQSGIERVVLRTTSTLLPSGAESKQAAQLLIACGHDTMSEVPAARWVVLIGEHTSVAAAAVRHAGLICSVDHFDHFTFKIAPGEASAMDPQQRLLLERGYSVLHQHGFLRGTVEGMLGGVFLGITLRDFEHIITQLPSNSSVYAATGTQPSIAAGRLSYVLGLHGPCIAFDTACSAALVACHSGNRALQRQECSMSIIFIRQRHARSEYGTSAGSSRNDFSNGSKLYF